MNNRKSTNVPESAQRMATFFPHPQLFDHRQLIITEEGRYSITKPKEALKITSHILETANELSINTSSIVDATACNGGDTLAFLDTFDSVTAVEISEENFKALKTNMKVFGFEQTCENPYKLRLLNDDYVQCLERFEAKIVYMDPPWGGPDYYRKTSLDLYLSSMNLRTLVPRIFDRTETTLLAIKVPFNFALQGLRQAVRSHDIRVRKEEISRSIHLLLLYRDRDILTRPAQTTSHKRKQESDEHLIKKKSKHPPIVWKAPSE